ncbi:hypothetical protein IQ264_27580 [Phormidium sp. LEGE 05292]|uniref:hypothetical protein n=1 Tax=[Phormidium] sp. LEGE 05292 TaxID=767427 RepID=UPI001881A8D6|nr:hypothetical protein [Phormidium sp. LEGE 05292]MBE9229169.1 hypothetical protein [Phormidium sp. LEGE 05292]
MSMNNVINTILENAAKTRENSYGKLPAKIPTIKLVTNPSQLRTSDIVDWGTIGKEFDFISSPLLVHSPNGVQLKLSSFGTFLRLNEGSGIKANFSSGDKLLFLEFADSAITIDFSTPVSGVGTQIQRAFFGAFTGVLEAFDSSGKSLGKFSVYTNNNANDDAAPFIGVLSQTANISRITLYVPENGGYGFTINGLHIVSRLDKPTVTPSSLEFNRVKSAGTGLNIYKCSNNVYIAP